MKIGYLVETPVTKEKRLYGAQISLLSLLAELKKHDVQPFVVVSEEWEITERLRSLGIDYLVTPIWEFFISLDGSYGAPPDSSVQNGIYAVSQPIIQEYFERNKVELVHMNTRFAGLLGAKVAKKMGIPYIFHIREFLAEDFGLAFTDEEFANELIRDSSLLIAVSESIRSYLSNLYSRTQIETIYNGVDVVRIALTGRIIQHKGQFDAIRAVETLCNKSSQRIELLIIGLRPDEMNDYEKMLLNYVRKNNLSNVIKFVPFTDRVEEVLKTCDIGLTCSKKEAFGRVTVEYMLSNLLAIGADCGGTSEIISNGVTGLLYKEGDYLQLAQSIEWAINNTQVANEIIRAGNKWAISNYSSVTNALNVLKTYQRILSAELINLGLQGAE
jgi:glycosyltransferase involved in cell wall biosynthesis